MADLQADLKGLNDSAVRPSFPAPDTQKSAIRKETPRKFRNKFVPFFENRRKIKEKKAKAAATQKKQDSPSKKTPQPQQEHQLTSAVKASVSSSYLDQLIQFERTEKQRLKEIQDKKEKPLLVDDFNKRKDDNHPKDLALRAGPGWIPHLPVQPHGGVEYWKFHQFHTEWATIVLSLGDTKNQSLWGTYVPQLAYNSGMLSNALVAFDALAMNRMKRDPNLAALASEKFYQSVTELTQAIQYVSSMNFMEIYVTSYIIACFAITEPSVAPIISKDSSQPEMFRIAKGMFHPDLKLLNEKYQPPSHFLLPHKLSKPPDLDSLDLEVLHSTEVSYFKILWDQLDSMAAGSTSISLLCEPHDDLPPDWDIATLDFDVPRKCEDLTSYEAVFGASGTAAAVAAAAATNYQLFEIDDSSAAETSPGTSDFSSSPEDYLSKSHEDFFTPETYLNHSPDFFADVSPVRPRDDLFKLLPGELETYRRCVLYMMHIAYDSVKSNRSNILMFSFNTISDEFNEFLRAGRPMALVITAYIMSIFQFKDQYMGDGGTYLHRMQELEQLTPLPWRPAFYWPKQILEEHRLHDSLAKLMEDLNLN